MVEDKKASDNAKEEKKAQEIAALVLRGTATEQEQGLVLKNVQTAISLPMIQQVDKLTREFEGFDELLIKAKDKLKVRLEENLETMSPEDLLSFINAISNQKLKVLDLERKIVQGKELIPGSVYSEEERGVINLIRSLDTKEKKESFLAMISNGLKSVNDAEKTDSKKESKVVNDITNDLDNNDF